MKKTILLFLILILSGCATIQEEKPVIYTTVYPIEYIVSELIGDNATVKSIIPIGGDPHSFEPTQQDIRGLAESKIYFHLGLHIEALADDVDKAIENEDVISVRLVDYFLDEFENYGHNEEDEHDEDEEHHNEHIWINPQFDIKMSEVASQVLIKEFPELEKEITQNLDKLVSDFKAIDEEYFALMESDEITKDTIIVSHDSYAYYDRYGINTLPVKDESHSKDPTQSEIMEIIQIAEEKNIDTVLYDQNIPCPPLDIIKKELNADSKILNNLSIRTHEDVKNDVNLIDMMKSNLEILKEVLK